MYDKLYHSSNYADPPLLKQFGGRISERSKGYICLFVCLVTSAIHVELATDLRIGFIATLTKFIARRGKYHLIYSDKGEKLNDMPK